MTDEHFDWSTHMLIESIREAPLFTYDEVLEFFEMAFGLLDEDQLISISQLFQALGFEVGTAVAVSVGDLVTPTSTPPWVNADFSKLSNTPV
jgi:hypothetical protein